MVRKNLKFIFTAALAMMAVVSCKDEEETETLPSLEGAVVLNYKDFEFLDNSTDASRTVKIIPSGVKHPEGGELSYAYTISPVMSSSETSEEEDGSFTYTFKDSLGTYTVTCSVSADGYYSSSGSYSATVVSQTKSLTGVGTDLLKSITDSRDGKTYKFTDKWGNWDWFCQNLAYAGDDSRTVGVPFRDSEVMNGIFGRYYTFNELENACPEGWSVPTEEAWADLARALWESDSENTQAPESTFGYYEGIAGMMMTDAYFNTIKLWEFWPEVDINNESDLSMIPVGFANVADGSNTFTGLYTYAAFWTATPDGENADRAFYKYLICGTPDVLTGAAYKDSFAAPVRCVRAK